MLLLALRDSRNSSEYNKMKLFILRERSLTSGKQIKYCVRVFFVISFVFMRSYLNVRTKKQPTAREETQVGFHFISVLLRNL